MCANPFPSRMRGAALHVKQILPRTPRRETLMEEALLGTVASQCECSHLGCPGLLAATKLRQQCSPDGVKEMILLQITRERFDLGQCCFWSGHVRQCYGPVQLDNRRGGHVKQQVVEGQDLWPVGGLPRLCFCVAGHQCSLDLIRAWMTHCRRLLDQFSCVANHLP